MTFSSIMQMKHFQNTLVKTEKFDSTMRELGAIIENFRFDFKRTLAVSDVYEVQKQMKEENKS